MGKEHPGQVSHHDNAYEVTLHDRPRTSPPPPPPSPAELGRVVIGGGVWGRKKGRVTGSLGQ